MIPAHFLSPPLIWEAKRASRKGLESLRYLGLAEVGTLCAAAHNSAGSTHNYGTGPRPVGGER